MWLQAKAKEAELLDVHAKLMDGAMENLLMLNAIVNDPTMSADNGLRKLCAPLATGCTPSPGCRQAARQAQMSHPSIAAAMVQACGTP